MRLETVDIPYDTTALRQDGSCQSRLTFCVYDPEWLHRSPQLAARLRRTAAFYLLDETIKKGESDTLGLAVDYVKVLSGEIVVRLRMNLGRIKQEKMADASTYDMRRAMERDFLTFARSESYRLGVVWGLVTALIVLLAGVTLSLLLMPGYLIVAVTFALVFGVAVGVFRKMTFKPVFRP